MRSSLVARASVLILAVVLAAGGLASETEAQTTDVLAGAVDGDFEAGGEGWEAIGGGQLVTDGSGPVHAGARAMRIEATDLRPSGMRSQYWLTPTEAQAPHTLHLWLYDDDPRTSGLRVELEFLDAGGVRRAAATASLGDSTSGWRLVTLTQVSPDGAAYVRVSARAEVSNAGATFFIDDVTLERGPGPAPTPTATPSPDPTASPGSTAPPTSTPTPTSSPAATTTGTPTGSVPRVFDALTNGGFEDGLYGWADVGANVEVIDGAARITSQSTSTKYLYQVVRVVPGGWYEAAAYLEPGSGVDAAWVRVAWYASDDGSGGQLSTADSAPLTAGAGEVRTGALQAPAEAHSAQVRIMLRPLSAAPAELTVDDVRFGPVPAPPAPTSTAAPIQTATAAASAPAAAAAPTPSPTSVATDLAPAPRLVAGRPADDASGAPTAGAAARSSSGSTNAGGARSTPAGGTQPGGAGTASTAAPALEGFAPEILLRITELMPDPSEPGNDADFEWVELSNVGGEPINLGGMTLRDNAGTVSLPNLVLQPGASLVVAGPRAAVPQTTAFRPAGGLSNGLGNSGDRLALLASDGRIIDALSYGSDVTYDNPPLPPPGAGRSLKRYFGDDGTYAGYEVSDEPSPGRFEPPPAHLAGPEGVTSGSADGAAGGGGGDRSVWYVLGGLGAVALAGAAGQRVWTLRHGSNGPGAGPL